MAALLDPEAFVFIDGTGASTKMARLTGWAPRGERVVDAVPHGHWHTTTFVCALATGGLGAPLVLSGPMNGEAFLAYTRQFLAPSLRKGRVVVLDNLPAHKVAGVREAIAAVGGTVMDLPPYSPDLNRVEMAFAKLKSLLRRCRARTRDELSDAIGKLLDRFDPDECRRDVEHAGCLRSCEERSSGSTETFETPIVA